jgi:hypothetical protein
MEHWWNDSDRGKRRYSEKTPSQCHFVYQKSPQGLACYLSWPRIKKILGIYCPVTIREPRKDGKRDREKEITYSNVAIH